MGSVVKAAVKRRTPAIVGKLKYLATTNPDHKQKIDFHVANLLKTIYSLNTPFAQVKNLGAYRNCLNVYKEVTGKNWVEAASV